MQWHRIDWRPSDAQHQNPAKARQRHFQEGQAAQNIRPGRRSPLGSRCASLGDASRFKFPPTSAWRSPTEENLEPIPAAMVPKTTWNTVKCENFAENEARPGRVVGGCLSLDRQFIEIAPTNLAARRTTRVILTMYAVLSLVLAQFSPMPLAGMQSAFSQICMVSQVPEWPAVNSRLGRSCLVRVRMTTSIPTFQCCNMHQKPSNTKKQRSLQTRALDSAQLVPLCFFFYFIMTLGSSHANP